MSHCLDDDVDRGRGWKFYTAVPTYITFILLSKLQTILKNIIRDTTCTNNRLDRRDFVFKFGIAAQYLISLGGFRVSSYATTKEIEHRFGANRPPANFYLTSSVRLCVDDMTYLCYLYLKTSYVQCETINT